MTIKINDIFLECPHRTPKRLHVETYLFFLTVHLGFLGGFMWRLASD
jgi:hypothetical protein